MQFPIYIYDSLIWICVNLSVAECNPLICYHRLNLYSIIVLRKPMHIFRTRRVREFFTQWIYTFQRTSSTSMSVQSSFFLLTGMFALLMRNYVREILITICIVLQGIPTLLIKRVYGGVFVDTLTSSYIFTFRWNCLESRNIDMYQASCAIILLQIFHKHIFLCVCNVVNIAILTSWILSY